MDFQTHSAHFLHDSQKCSGESVQKESLASVAFEYKLIQVLLEPKVQLTS